MCEGCGQPMLVPSTLYDFIAARAAYEALMPYIERYPQVSPAPLSDRADLAQRCHAAYLEASR